MSMDYEENEGVQQEYYIPQNYDDAGGVFGGRFTQRTGIEMAVVGLPLLFINLNFIFPFVKLDIGLIVLMLTVLPPVGFCAVGIFGENVSQFLAAYLRFLKRRRFLSFVCFSDGKKNGKRFLPIKHAEEDTSEPEEPDYPMDDDDDDEPEPIHRAKEETPQKARKTETHMHIMNSAMKEMLLKKFELGDDDDE